MEEWKNGRMEEWKDGRMEEWKNGRMEGWENSPTSAALSVFIVRISTFLFQHISNGVH